MDSNKYLLKITNEALSALNKAIDYITVTLHNPIAGEKLYHDFYDKINTIVQFPFSMPKIKLNYGVNYRKFFIGNYVAVYLIDEKEKIIYIMSFRYASMFLGDSI